METLSGQDLEVIPSQGRDPTRKWKSKTGKQAQGSICRTKEECRRELRSYPQVVKEMPFPLLEIKSQKFGQVKQGKSFKQANYSAF